jgi:TolB protein
MLYTPERGYQVYVMRPDGTRQRRLTSLGANLQPSWSPSGKKIAFTSTRDGIAGEIYKMDADGTDQVNLTNDPAGTDGEPAYSPNGKKITFQSYHDGGPPEIYKMPSSGGEPTNLTDYPAFDAYPSWQPLR